jgi:hypothetical protein
MTMMETEMEKKRPPPKKTSAVKYMFGALRAAQSQYKNGRTRLTRQQPTTPPTVDEMLKQMRGERERKAE